MKIKELHLRNIASIEEADIDFEKDLVDGVTGTPASVFLIAGDTGTGKSIILDGISMALYKTTPRLKGVANQQSNEFKDAGGETIRVASLEQYTRLGIAPKDPCYSQVVFEGNDGKEYRATLTLGLMNGRADAEGNKPVKHSTPSWKLTVGTEEYSKDGDIRDMIDKAVGLDFNQFSRMAMLAQGQFAAFLTGDKKKREEMLAHNIRPTTKIDIDNISKAVCDALNKVAYYDDSQIVVLKARKYYADEPGVNITIYAVGNEEAL